MTKPQEAFPEPTETKEITSKSHEKNKRDNRKKGLNKPAGIAGSSFLGLEEGQPDSQQVLNEPEIAVIDSNPDSEDQDKNRRKQNKPYPNLDLETLKPEKRLNGAVIDESLKLLKERYDRHDRLYISSSFFYTRLKSAKINEEGCYQATKNWFNGVDLFTKNLWFVPVYDSHWFLIAVKNPGKKHSHITVLNSVSIETHQVAVDIRNFLAKKFQREEDKATKLRLPKIYYPPVPQHFNIHDCEFYLLQYAETILAHKRAFMQSAGKMKKHWKRIQPPNREQVVNELRVNKNVIE